MLKSFAPLKIRLSLEGDYLMDYRIEKKEAFTVIANVKVFPYEGAKESVPQFWQEHFQTGKGKVVMGEYGINVDEKINRAYGKQITSKQVYQILQFFDKMYNEKIFQVELEEGKDMDKPNYVLKTNEAVLVPTNQSGANTFIKIGVWIVVGIIVLGSVVFQDNLFAELSWTARCFLIILATGVLFARKKEDVPSPMELQFFNDYLILYLPKRYYSKSVTRMEINKMMYREITKCVYKIKSERIQIYGNGTSICYNYDASGNLPKVPTQNRNYMDGMICFSTKLAHDVNFKQEIEAHSPIVVIVEND